MDLKISPAPLRGKLKAPPSKSYSHRALICAGLAEGESLIRNIGRSKDIEATAGCMRQLGASLNFTGSDCLVRGAEGSAFPRGEFYCNESGSTLRFLVPIALAVGGRGSFTGAERLFERPLEPYFLIFEKDGIKYKLNKGLTVSGSFKGGRYRLHGGISSQFLSGLLFALPLLEESSAVEVVGDLESRPYVDMTLEILKEFGITIRNEDYRLFHCKGKQVYCPSSISIEGDYSQAAFFLAANSLGNDISVEGLNPSSLQGDKEIVSLISRMENESDCVLDMSQTPDLVPIVAVLAALREGRETVIVKAERLRIKESDRLAAISKELNTLGASVLERPDGLLIKGVRKLKGGTVYGHNDHRIAMALSIAALRADGAISLRGAECVQKSYPDYWEEYKKLGGELLEI